MIIKQYSTKRKVTNNILKDQKKFEAFIMNMFKLTNTAKSLAFKINL